MNNRARLFEIIEKSQNGPIVSESDFDKIHVIKNLRQVVKKYDIKLTNPDTIINMDTDLEDRVWDAAMEFLANCGILSRETSRVIIYTEKELRDLIRLAPTETVYGFGLDTYKDRARTPDCTIKPMCCGSSIGTPAPNRYTEPIMVSYLQEPLIDMHGVTSNLSSIKGSELRSKSPYEILACWDTVDKFKQTAKSVGRPGIALHGINLSLSDIGQLSAGHLLSKTDSHMYGLVSELKVDNTILNKMTHTALLDANSAVYANPIYGGLGGGVPGQMVLLCAEMIALSTMMLATNAGSTPIHPIHFCSTTKEIMQVTNVAFGALTRHATLMTRLAQTMCGGPVTKMLLYEVIAATIVSTKSGISRIDGPRPATGVFPGHCTGLEARFQAEVIRAAPHLDRGKAEEIVQKAYSCYGNDFEKKPYGKPFWEAYDMDTLKPTEEWNRMYEEVKEEAISWGLPL